MRFYSYFVRGAQHAAMARTSMLSAKRADPSAYIIAVTDEQNPPWEIDLAGQLLVIPEGMPMMLANLEAQVAAIIAASRWPNSEIAFVDTDTLIRRPLDGLDEAHLAVTWRDHVRVVDEEKIEGIAGVMPYNYGVILTRPSQPAIEAFIWMRERVRKMHERHQQWYGNQLALAALCGAPPQSGERTDLRQIPWHLTRPGASLLVRKLPCEVWNYTPEKAGEDVAERVLLHFKGHARGLMEGYALDMGLVRLAA